MSKLKYLPDEKWASIPADDFRARFLVEAYVEKLRMHTPHFYQARLMNVFNVASELIEYIEAYRENDKNAQYIFSCLDEFDECWRVDPVASRLLRDLESTRAAVCKALKGGDFSSNSLNALLVLSTAIIKRRDEYAVQLQQSLENAAVNPADLTHKTRIAEELDLIVGLYTTHLLSEGFSPTYLYTRASKLYRASEYGGRTFADQLHLVLDRLQTNRTSYKVYFGIHARKPSLLVDASANGVGSISFFTPEAIDLQPIALKSLAFPNEEAAKLIACVAIDGRDHVSAALRAKEALDVFLDTATALEMHSQVQVSSACRTNFQLNNSSYSEEVKIDLLLEFLSSEVGTSFAHPATSIRQTFKVLTPDARDQLGRSLRYLRLARTAVSLEQKLLNLWIALESLFVGSDLNILSNILVYVPPLYAHAGIMRRVNYLRDLLVENRIAKTELAFAHCPGGPTFDDLATNSQIFSLIRDGVACEELFDSIGELDHLKFKLLQIRGELKGNKEIRSRLSKSSSDVAKQLRRIYSIRNKIAHTGHYQVRPQLVIHLLDYVAISYRALSAAASRVTGGSVYTVAELLTSSKLGVEVVLERVTGNQNLIGSFDDLSASPVL
jgi:hypothetical protein